jgi:hypothetical protein
MPVNPGSVSGAGSGIQKNAFLFILDLEGNIDQNSKAF